MFVLCFDEDVDVHIGIRRFSREWEVPRSLKVVVFIVHYSILKFEFVKF